MKLKLDISKAFDSVSWPFLLEVLQHLGFGQRWCNLLCLILSTSSTQVLVNGESGAAIHHRRGLHQGDPLSPMLFILVMDVFLRPYRMDLQVIKRILDLFGHASSLRTNLSKSSISPIHCSTEDLHLTTEILACAVKDFPCTYLGLPLSIHKPTKEVLLPLVDKMADLLLGWGRLS